jgi:hypothetical protein
VSFPHFFFLPKKNQCINSFFLPISRMHQIKRHVLQFSLQDWLQLIFDIFTLVLFYTFVVFNLRVCLHFQDAHNKLSSSDDHELTHRMYWLVFFVVMLILCLGAIRTFNVHFGSIQHFSYTSILFLFPIAHLMPIGFYIFARIDSKFGPLYSGDIISLDSSEKTEQIRKNLPFLHRILSKIDFFFVQRDRLLMLLHLVSIVEVGAIFVYYNYGQMSEIENKLLKCILLSLFIKNVRLMTESTDKC